MEILEVVEMQAKKARPFISDPVLYDCLRIGEKSPSQIGRDGWECVGSHELVNHIMTVNPETVLKLTEVVKAAKATAKALEGCEVYGVSHLQKALDALQKPKVL